MPNEPGAITREVDRVLDAVPAGSVKDWIETADMLLRAMASVLDQIIDSNGGTTTPFVFPVDPSG